jgi:hypothetical protein
MRSEKRGSCVEGRKERMSWSHRLLPTIACQKKNKEHERSTLVLHPPNNAVTDWNRDLCDVVCGCGLTTLTVFSNVNMTGVATQQQSNRVCTVATHPHVYAFDANMNQQRARQSAPHLHDDWLFLST